MTTEPEAGEELVEPVPQRLDEVTKAMRVTIFGKGFTMLEVLRGLETLTAEVIINASNSRDDALNTASGVSGDLENIINMFWKPMPGAEHTQERMQ